MNDTTAAESTDLVVVRTLNAALVFVPGGVDAVIEKLIAEVRSVKTDISTPTGRAAVASLAYKVARSKTALDEMGKNLVADWKAKANAVDADRRVVRDKLDALRDEVRKPLDDWENADSLRIEAHEAAIEALQMLSVFDGAEPSVEEIDRRLAALKDQPVREWQEFSKRAVETSDAALTALTKIRATAAMQAELDRLRREQIAREQKDRDDKIAAEAASKARIEAEAKAREEARVAAEKAEAERKRIEDQKRQAEEQARQAEAARLAAEAKAKEEAEATARQVEADKKVAAEKAERDRTAAVEAERQRAADAERAEAAATAKRAADKKHRAKINNEALVALVATGLTNEQGVVVVTAIAQGMIPHTSIAY